MMMTTIIAAMQDSLITLESSKTGWKTQESLKDTSPHVLEVGKEYEVEITQISRQGDGIARVQGFVVFVKSGKVGQNVKVKVEQVENSFATATLLV